VQRVHALCCRVQTVIAQDDACASEFVVFHKRLEPFVCNRLHVIWDSFGLQHVSDFLRLHMTGHSDVYTAAALAHQPALTSHNMTTTTSNRAGDVPTGTAGEWTMRSTQFTKASDHFGAAGGLEAPKTGSQQASCQNTSAPMRYQHLRESGHPFIMIVDTMLQVSSCPHSG
jgi:hypothetical protein